MYRLAVQVLLHSYKYSFTVHYMYEYTIWVIHCLGIFISIITPLDHGYWSRCLFLVQNIVHLLLNPIHIYMTVLTRLQVPVEKQLAWVCSSSPYNRAPTDAERRAMLDEMRAEIIRSEHYNVATDSTPFTLVYSIVWAQCRKEYS